MGDIVIRIDRDTVAADCKRVVEIPIGPKTGDLFTGNEGLEWNVADSLKDAKLTCELSGESLSVGENDDEDLVVEFTREKIQNDRPGRITVTVPEPQAVSPGFYQGSIKAWFENKNKGVDRYEGEWRITVAVEGRILESLTFANEASGVLRVGQMASVNAVIHCIGCDAGAGDLTMDLLQAGNKESALHIPVPLERSLDPRTMLTGDDAIGSAHKKWADSVISSSLRSVDSEFVDPNDLHQAYELRVELPRCFEPGSFVAKLDWKQAGKAPSAANQSLGVTQRIHVDGGIYIFPSLVSTNERVTIRAVSRDDLGESIQLTVKGPKNESYNAAAKKKTGGTGAVGGFTEYEVRFRAPSTGQWEVTWPDNPAVSDALGRSSKFEVWLDISNNLSTPITVFASATPILWEVWSDPYKGSGWEETRKNALSVRFDEHFLKNVRVTPVGFFKAASNDRFQRYDPAMAPTMRMVPQGGHASSPQPIKQPDSKGTQDAVGDGSDRNRADEDERDNSSAASSQQKSMNSSTATTPLRVPISGLVFDAVVTLDQDNEEHPGNAVSKERYYFRAMVEGTGPQEEPVYKIVMLPLNVNVTTDWEWYKTKIWWTLGVVLFCIVLFAIWRMANPPLKKSADTESLIEKTTNSEIDDFASKPTSQKKTEDKSSNVGEGEPTEPAPEPETEPDVDDDDLTGFTS